ncbi:lysylphosphatidylglycerol synthase domain-containing protein [Halobaculum sp. MBLA0143]|uniref:lysylphosphatidylglycerol synthase domain-containing protein n=1 Tax=Halobaculum sp. MBLA0143 TaxID=3079933 RepID=UPI003526906F
MRRRLRFLVGLALGGGALAVGLQFVGTDAVVASARRLAPWALAVVAVLVAAEAVVDGLGVWASARPLAGGLSAADSVKFALAGDFFDTVSPAGPVSSEPVVARFLAVETDTGYADALGVRSTAKYVKSGTQLLASLALGGVVLLGVGATGPSSTAVLTVLGGAAVLLVAGGVVVVRARAPLSRGVVAVLTPTLGRGARLLGREPPTRAAVEAAVDRFWGRALVFGARPRLLAAIALAGVAEQLLAASTLWVALVAADVTAPLSAVAAVVPLTRVASVVPVPGSLGAYDLLLVGALVAVVAVPTAPATAAVLVVRAAALPFALVAGGVAVAFLRGWRPTNG